MVLKFLSVTSTTTDFVIDNNNPTGFAQILEEKQATNIFRSYTLGLDVINQADNPANPADVQVDYLLYDGHGSTRALLDENGDIISGEVYAYDAFGNHLGNFPANPMTTLLYSGEQTDAATGQQYLRNRYYDPANGRFNRTDPFGGNVDDPLSLHKYLYTHGDPVNGIDPTGREFTISGLMGNISAFGRAVGTKVASTFTVRRFALATLTGIQNIATVGTSLGIIAQDPIPDGIMINIGVGTAGASFAGIAGAATANLYVERTGRMYLYFSGEAGIDPVRSQRNQFDPRSTNFTYGFVWNVNQPSDISGLSSVSTIPWIVLKNYQLLDPRRSLASGLNPLLALLARYNIGNITSGTGVGQVMLSSSGATGIFYGRRSYTWAATAGLTSPPINLPRIQDLAQYGLEFAVQGTRQLLNYMAGNRVISLPG